MYQSEALFVQNIRDEAHGSREYLWSGSQSKAQNFELKADSFPHEAEKLSRFGVYWNLKIRILEVEGHEPIRVPDG